MITVHDDQNHFPVCMSMGGNQGKDEAIAANIAELLNQFDSRSKTKNAQWMRDRNSKTERRLVAELLESNRIISQDAKRIFTLGEQVKHLQAEVERLKAAFGPTIELLQHIEWDFEYAAIHKTELVLTQKSDRPALQRELARLLAIVEKGTE
jgi:hypothetical protein